MLQNANLSDRLTDTASTGQMARPVVFFLPGLTGDLSELAALQAGCQDALCPVSINYPHWTEIRNDVIGLDAFVAYCRQQIESHPAPGPKLLAGYSFGGHIGLEVAAELEASGIVIGRLGLLDASAVPAVQSGPRSTARRLRDLAAAFQNGELDSQVGRIIAGLMRMSGYEWPLRLAARLRHVRLPRDMGKHIDVALQMHYHFQLLLELLDRMERRPAPCGFPAVLFRCIDHQRNEPDDLLWTRHVAHLRIVPIGGDHISLMDPENIASLCGTFAGAMTDEPAHPEGFRGQADMVC